MQNYQTTFYSLLLVLVTALTSYGQQQMSLVSQEKSNLQLLKIDRILKDFKILKLNSESHSGNDNRSLSNIQIDFGNEAITFNLEKNDICPIDVPIKILAENGNYSYHLPKNLNTYQGYSTDGKMQIRLTTNDDFVYGTVISNETQWHIEPMTYYESSKPSNEFVLYKDSDIAPEYASHTCRNPNVTQEAEDKHTENEGLRTGDCFKTKIAVLADYSMYTDPAHSGVDNVINHVIAVLNNAEIHYDYNGTVNFDDGLNFEISELVISTCTSCDPLSTTTSPTALLAEFNAWVQAGGFEHTFNGAHFWTNRDLVGATVGLAYQSTNLYCMANAIAILEDWTNTAALLEVMLAHEIGHNLNGVHDATTGYILSPTVTSTSLWSALSKSAIGPQITNQGSACLDPCGPVLCDRVENISISNITQTSFDAQWNATAQGEYLVKVREKGQSTFLQSFTTTQNSLTITPPGFEICKKYEVFVYNICGSSYSALQRIIIESPTSQGCAFFNVQNPLGWENHQAQFNNTSVNGTSYFWDFGNGQTSTSASPVATYTTPGTYDVSLTVNGIHTTTIQNAVNILPTFIAPFTVAQGGNMDYSGMMFCPFTISGTVNLWEKGTSSGTSSSPLYTNTNAWKTGLSSTLPIATTKSALFTPRFNLTYYNNYTLNFDLSVHTLFCNGPAGLQLQYSTDGGSTWTRLGDDLSFYTTGPNQPCALASQVFTDLIGWTNYFSTPTHYVPKSIDISFLSGNSNVAFRFVASVSGIFSAGYNADGFLVDNFNISAANAIVMAIEDTHLNAELKNGNRPYLSWSIDNIVELSKYILERSSDGIAFSKVNSWSNENLKQDNEFLDEPISSKSYYRVKMVDHNGKVVYSNIEKVTPTTITTVEITPTLVNKTSTLNIKVIGERSDILNMTVLQLSGAVVSNWNKQFPESIDVSAMAVGTYILNIVYRDGHIQSEKFSVY